LSKSQAVVDSTLNNRRGRRHLKMVKAKAERRSEKRLCQTQKNEKMQKTVS
jgi:hypothetical protein